MGTTVNRSQRKLLATTLFVIGGMALVATGFVAWALTGGQIRSDFETTYLGALATRPWSPSLQSSWGGYIRLGGKGD